MINIRERKYEIGVLRTIGMKKSKVSLQFISELLIVAIISLSIGAVAGSFASVPVSNMLLQEEISNSQSEYEDISINFGINMPPEEENVEQSSESKDNNTGETQENNTIESEDNNTEKTTSNEEKYNFNIANVEEINRIDAVVDFKILAQLLLIGIALTLLSSLASMIAISRFSPLTILKERS